MKKLIPFFTFLLILSVSLQAQSGEIYEFDHEVKTQMHQYENDQKQGTFDYAFLYPDNGGYIGIVGQMDYQGQKMETKAVYDIDQHSVLVLLDQGGMKMGMKMNTSEASEMQSGEESEPTIKKTGRTKDIMGYSADEYEITDEDSYSLVWMTEELDFPSFYEAFASMNQKEKMMSGDIPDGFLLALTTWPEGKSGSKRFTMEVTEINEGKENQISSEGYRIMSMPSR